MNNHLISVAGRTNLETSIPSVTSSEAPLAFRVPLTHYVGDEFEQVRSDVRSYDGKLYTNDLFYWDSMHGHPSEEVKAGTIPAERYERHEAGAAPDRLKYDMQQFVLIDGEAWIQCGEPAYQVLAGREGIVIEATIDLKAAGRPGIQFAANDWGSALMQGFAIAADRGIGNFDEALEAAQRIHVLDERAISREPYEELLERKTREVQTIAGIITSIASAAKTESILDARETFRGIETAIATAREVMESIYVVPGS